MLLHILTPTPLPCSPAWSIFCPIISKSGVANFTASWLPPTKKFNLPTLAPITPPVTGASIILIPKDFA